MRYLCKMCGLFFDIHDPELAENHIKKIHGADKLDDSAWKKRNFLVEDDNGNWYQLRADT